MPYNLTNSLPMSDPTNTKKNVDYKTLYDYGHTSYNDPSTGQMTYLDRITPDKGTSLSPMDMYNPQPVGGPPAKPGPMDDTVNQLLASVGGRMGGGGGGGSAPGVDPFGNNLAGKLPSFGDFYKRAGGNVDQYFKDYTDSLNAPSSVDAVQRSMDQDYLKQALEGIDIDTHKAIGSSKMDSADRGLLGPGENSDIAQNSIAQVLSDSNRTKAGVRTTLANSELARQKAREDALKSAYGERYKTGATAALTGAQSDSAAAADLLGKEYGGAITREQGALDRGSKENMNYLNTILDYAIKKGTLSQEDAQFYAKLISGEQMNTQNNAANYRMNYDVNQMNKKDNLPDYLNAGANVASAFF